MTKTFFNRFNSVFILLLATMMTNNELIAATDAGESTHEFIGNKNITMKPQRQEALRWILDNWIHISQRVFPELRKQALLRHHKLNFDDKDMSLLIDDSDPEWSGFWALVISGETPEYESSYCYYIELRRESIMLSYVYGIGFNIGIPPVRRVRDSLVNRDIVDFRIAKLSECEKEVISGVWVSTKISDVDVFNKCFNFDYRWGDGELDKSVYLNIDLNLSCEVVVPYAGASGNSWHGVIQGIEVDKWGRFVTLTQVELKDQNLDFGKAKFINISSEKVLQIWQGDKFFEFQRNLKSPMFNFEYKDSLNNLRVGVLKRKLSE